MIDFFIFLTNDAVVKGFFRNFVRRIDILEREPKVFQDTKEQPQLNINVKTRRLPLTPNRGVSIGGIRQFHVGRGWPFGVCVYSKVLCASF